METKILKQKKAVAVKDMNRFHKWMLKLKNVHLADNEGMSEAFQKVYDSNMI